MRVGLALAALGMTGSALAQERPPAGSPPVIPIAASKIILVGDSTTAVVGGWGPSFCAYNVTSFAACINLARGGRSSGSYLWEGSWNLVQGEMRTPGYRNIWVLIQFGHNDQPGKPGRSTDLAKDFPANLERYVRDVRAAGAKPVLVTPLTRRMFKGAALDNDLEPWAASIRTVARRLNVPLADLNAVSVKAVNEMGEAAAERFAPLAKDAAPFTSGGPQATEVDDRPGGSVRLSFDRTHLGLLGANYFADMMARELAVAVPEMRPLLLSLQQRPDVTNHIRQ
ncbi:lysophospholipase [Sphingomonas turrisvirgatae]|uniref:Lysophospholipase n=2 Tax=Sphingomonas turrisvirgatae TaxID=1888892 RepID=A0A1E3M0V4_9SPHN|nr:lysophospholipase [Sphingomonas turrisvirgatae]